jgi:non-ribosomal peptide synthase protein (TIGR01720 family)
MSWSRLHDPREKVDAARRGLGLERDETLVRTRLDEAATQRFERRAHDARATGEDLCVAALAAALGDVTGRAEAWIEVEGHGRDDRASGAPDVARTLGWFTELAGARVDLSEARTPAAALRVAREALRAARRAPDAALPASRAPDVSFNWLGRLDAVLGGGRFLLVEAGRDRAPSTRRSHLLEIDARLERGRLHVDWACPAAARSRVERLAAAFEARLGELCATDGARATRPVNDALAGLDDAALARVLDQLDGGFDPGGGDA